MYPYIVSVKQNVSVHCMCGNIVSVHLSLIVERCDCILYLWKDVAVYCNCLKMWLYIVLMERCVFP